MKHFRRLAVFRSRDERKTTPEAQSALYCREYQFAEPDRHSRGRPSYLRVDEESVGKSLSYSPINGLDGIDTVFCSHFQQLSNVSHSNICLAVAGNNAVGVEAELLRISLAKSELNSADGILWSMVLPELQNTISRNNTVEKYVCPQNTLMLMNNATRSRTTINGVYAGALVSRLVGSMRNVQIPGSTLMRSNCPQQLEKNEVIIANVAKSTQFPLQSDMRLLHCTNLQAKFPDQSQTHSKQQARTRIAPPMAKSTCNPAPSTPLDTL